MSIVRVGLAETKGFAEGYEAIFGKKKEEEGREQKAEAADKSEKRGQEARETEGLTALRFQCSARPDRGGPV